MMYAISLLTLVHFARIEVRSTSQRGTHMYAYRYQGAFVLLYVITLVSYGAMGFHLVDRGLSLIGRHSFTDSLLLY